MCKQHHKENFANYKIFGYTCPQQTTNGDLRHFKACFSKMTKMKSIIHFPLSQRHGLSQLLQV
jgi:hypothetical protein